MYIVDGIAYAGTNKDNIRVEAVKPLDDMMMLVIFSSGEKRLFDATKLLDCPAFQPLREEKIFNTVSVDRGVVTWLDGDIDIAPEAMYRDSITYEEIRV